MRGKFRLVTRRGYTQIFRRECADAHHFQIGESGVQNIRQGRHVGHCRRGFVVADVHQAVLQRVELDDLIGGQTGFLQGRHARSLILYARRFVAQIGHGVDGCVAAPPRYRLPGHEVGTRKRVPFLLALGCNRHAGHDEISLA